MRVVVVEPPEPIVFPQDVPGDHSHDDAFVTAMIAAATSNIDGPSGWLGCSIGGQVLDGFADAFPCSQIRLPCGPVIDVQSVTYRDAAGTEQTLSPSAYRVRGDMLELASGITWPATSSEREAVCVRYRAGYAKPKADGLEDVVPASIKAAIVLMTVGLLTAQARDGGLRGVEAPGVYSKQFNSPEMMDRVRTATVERLLAPFQVYAP